MSTISSAVRCSALLTAVLSLSSCETMSSLGSMDAILKNVGGLTGKIGEWSSSLGSGDITDTILKKLTGFSGQAGSIGDALRKALTGADDSTKKKLSPVQDGLKKLGGLNMDSLKNLDQGGRKSAVQDFTGAAKSLGDLVKKLMG